MRYDQIIYYPPFERHSLLLQVTCGCSYNQCAFCNMYKTVDFEVIPLKQIIADLKDASGYNPYTERVFLVGGEPLCLPFEQMKEILTQIKKYLPYCACVSMYASIKNLRDKTVEQLKELHRLGLGFLYIGLESGSDRILKQMKKGHTAAKDGSFVQASGRERIEELAYLLEALELTTPTGFSTSHVTNPVMITGTLPYDKEKMLEGVYKMLGSGKESDLHGIVSISDAAIER